MLLEHNQTTLAQVRTFIENGRNCCVVNPCGSGKTSVMSAFIGEHPNSSFVIMTRQKNAANYYREKHPVFSGDNVHIVTYDKMHRDVKTENIKAYDTDYFILDEAHYIGADAWCKSFLHLVALYEPVLIGFTATPQRFEDQGTDTTVVNTFFSNNSAGNFTTQDLEKKGVFIEPTYVPTVYDLPETVNRKIDQVIESSLDDSEKQQLCKRLNDVLNNWMQNSRPSHLMQKHLPEYMYKPSCNRILVYISSVEYATDRQQFIDSTLHEIFPGKTIKSYVYTYKTSEAPLHDFLAEDDTTYIKVLYSIDKIMETIHIDDLRILIMMRPSVSNRIITQQFGRVNSIANQNKPLILDMVDNLSVLNQKTLRDTERIPRKAPTPKTHTNILVPTLTFYSNLFQSIDAAIKRAKYYTYHGFTGTLKEMCYVFDADYDEARNMLDTHNIEDVMDSLSCSADYAENAVPRHVKSDEDIALTSEQKEYAERNMHLVDNFIRNHNIEDEDMQQNLYLCYLQRVISTADHAFPYPAIRRMFVINAVRAKYLGLYRQSVKTSYQTVPWDEYTANDINTGTHSEITLAQISDAIDQVMSNLQPRQRKVLSLRFGFTDGTEWTYAKIGKEMHCTGGRISQIAAKALRKLRHPSSIRYLRDFLDVFDQ